MGSASTIPQKAGGSENCAHAILKNPAEGGGEGGLRGGESRRKHLYEEWKCESFRHPDITVSQRERAHVGETVSECCAANEDLEIQSQAPAGEALAVAH